MNIPTPIRNRPAVLLRIPTPLFRMPQIVVVLPLPVMPPPLPNKSATGICVHEHGGFNLDKYRITAAQILCRRETDVRTCAVQDPVMRTDIAGTSIVAPLAFTKSQFMKIVPPMVTVLCGHAAGDAKAAATATTTALAFIAPPSPRVISRSMRRSRANSPEHLVHAQHERFRKTSLP
jgi:hypothetical protein